MPKKHFFITANRAFLLCTLMFGAGCSDEKKPEAVSEQQAIESENAYLLERTPEQVNKALRFLEIAEKMGKRGKCSVSH